MSREMELLRLNKFLSEIGFCSRREADRLVQEGRISVDGRQAVVGQKVSRRQEIVCDGRVVYEKKAEADREVIWLVVNKPRGVVCTTSDNDRAENIVEMINYPSRVYPVGRLDKDSEGLILMTNQGELVNKILKSKNAHEKEYEVRVNKPVTREFLEKMAAGVELKELHQVTRPCRVSAIGKDSFRIILTQGLNRQIRRMCEVFGYKVLQLKRVRIINIHLGTLKPGGFRRMSREEYQEMSVILEKEDSYGGKNSSDKGTVSTSLSGSKGVLSGKPRDYK